jgi:hypothetical protein
MRKNLAYIFLFLTTFCFAQTKVSGYVYDENNEPVSFANVLFKNSTTGTITDENGKFYMEIDGNYTTLIISFIGYKNKEIVLDGSVNYDLKVTIKEEASALDEVVVYSGKQSKKKQSCD